MKIWILGGQGCIGRALQRACMKKEITWIASCRKEVDVLDLQRLITMGNCVQPTHIVNCAAYRGPLMDHLFEINARGAKNVAIAAYTLGAELVHLSESYVFDLLGKRPYREEDPCKPLSVYGQSRLAGEQFVREVMPGACIMRTGWVFGQGGNHIISQWPRLFTEHEIVRVSSDEVGSPTYADDLVEVILAMLGKTGLFHFNNNGIFSSYQVAQSLYEKLRAGEKKLKCQKIEPVLTGSRYSALDTSSIEKILGKSPRHWDDILDEFVESL